MKTWAGAAVSQDDKSRERLKLFERFSSSIRTDVRLAQYDVRCSQVHAWALSRTGVISGEDAGVLELGLAQVLGKIDSGELALRDDLEDIHTHVEARLTELVGPLAGALHAGRSRNDQIATDLRLFTKDSTARIALGVCDLTRAFLRTAQRHAELLIPGYTHLQRGQPVLVAHYLLAYVEMLARDLARFDEVWTAADQCPLGSGALAGAGFALDRAWMAQQLDFARPTANSMDTVADRDFLADYLYAGSLLMVHLSRLAEDLILWSTTEFSFVRLPSEFTSGSSMMPQKRNPDALELVRGSSSKLLGKLMTALSALKGLPMTYDRDLQVLTEELVTASDTIMACLDIVTPLVDNLSLDQTRLQDAASGSALATDLADELVRRGTPFRQAHARVSRLVRSLTEQGRTLDDAGSDEIAEVLEVGDDTAACMLPLSPRRSVAARSTLGSTNPDMVRERMGAAGSASQLLRERWATRLQRFQERMSVSTS